MASNKLSTNIIFNIINQVFNVAVPLITAPYIARVLSAELIGSYSYTLANSSYFVLFGCLGLAQHGTIRAVIKRNSKYELSCLFWEITFLKMILSAICMGIYGVVFVAGSSGMNRVLYIIMTMNIVANALDAGWILNGLEEFKVMALRNIGVRLLTVVSIILFVKDAGDFYIYAFIMQFSTLAGYCSVYPILKSRITWTGFKNINIIQHFAPALVYFVPGIVSTIFSSTDKTMIGAMANEYEVGVYDQANKICMLCAAIINSVSSVLLPRTIHMYHNESNRNGLDRLVKSSLQGIAILAFPIALGTIAISKCFVDVMYGPGYEKSAVLLKILSLNILVSAISNLCGQQCLIARGRQREYNISIIVSALLNVGLNACLVPTMWSEGASYASVIAAVIGFAVALWFSRDMLPALKFFKYIANYALAAIIMLFLVICISIEGEPIWTMVAQIVLAAVIYFGMLLICRDEMVFSFIAVVKGKLIRKNT